MKYLSVIEQPTKEAVAAYAEKRNLTRYMPESYQHPQEDYLAVSDTPPVFVVADGVTLDFQKFIERNTKYPTPSPAGDVAKIFCESITRRIRDRFTEFDLDTVVGVFKDANREVRQYNQAVGRSEDAGNPTGYYAATGSFITVKDGRAYWATICDSFIAHFTEEMEVRFISSGSCAPYAVINGEEKMVQYLEKGVFSVNSGDRIFVFTDGFEHYIKNPEFQRIFRHWDDGLEQRIKEFSVEMNLLNPEKYGHERSLIAVLI